MFQALFPVHFLLWKSSQISAPCEGQMIYISPDGRSVTDLSSFCQSDGEVGHVSLQVLRETSQISEHSSYISFWLSVKFTSNVWVKFYFDFYCAYKSHKLVFTFLIKYLILHHWKLEWYMAEILIKYWVGEEDRDRSDVWYMSCDRTIDEVCVMQV